MPYYGEINCQFSTKTGPCKNKAYYEYEDRYGCGVHIKNKDRIELPKQDEKEKEQMLAERYQQHLQTVALAREENLKLQRKGQVILCRMFMMKTPEQRYGFLNVYPNYKDQNRKDGFGCSSLSPKSMGPIEHGQPGLPISKNLENFHQANKVYGEEVDEHGNPNEIYYLNRINFYQDPVPHRHKYKGTGKNINIPLYSIWIDKEGKEHRLTYIESRQFYCNFYERFALVDPNFIYIKSLIETGVNIQICGYDAFNLLYDRDGNPDFESSYLDSSSPFGHEKVLMALLILNPEQYPWRKHKTFDF